MLPLRGQRSAPGSQGELLECAQRVQRLIRWRFGRQGVASAMSARSGCLECYPGGGMLAGHGGSHRQNPLKAADGAGAASVRALQYARRFKVAHPAAARSLRCCRAPAACGWRGCFAAWSLAASCATCCRGWWAALRPWSRALVSHPQCAWAASLTSCLRRYCAAWLAAAFA